MNVTEVSIYCMLQLLENMTYESCVRGTGVRCTFCMSHIHFVLTTGESDFQKTHRVKVNSENTGSVFL